MKVALLRHEVSISPMVRMSYYPFDGVVKRGIPLKRDRKRQICDYSKFCETDKEYYGLFRKKDKLRIDVKRLAKSEIVSSEIITQINNIPRNTAYFFPEKKKRLDYNCNVFRSDLDSLLSIWNTEIFPMIKNIRTPSETEHKAYVSYISDGIMDHDEAYAASIMKGIRRIPTYNSVLYMIYGQYIHLIGSAVEYSMIKVLEKNEHSLERIDREAVNGILKRHYNIEINEIPMAENYNKFYTLWNFLKHNSISSYKSIKKEYPEILVEEPFRNGQFALWYVNLEERVIVETLNGLKKFFDSFCEHVFGENLGEADWNYDEYFFEKYEI